MHFACRSLHSQCVRDSPTCCTPSCAWNCGAPVRETSFLGYGAALHNRLPSNHKPTPRTQCKGETPCTGHEHLFMDSKISCITERKNFLRESTVIHGNEAAHASSDQRCWACRGSHPKAPVTARTSTNELRAPGNVLHRCALGNLKKT